MSGLVAILAFNDLTTGCEFRLEWKKVILNLVNNSGMRKYHLAIRTDKDPASHRYIWIEVRFYRTIYANHDV